MVEISEALEVDGKIILDFIRDGSLELSEDSYALTCERCHKPIAQGRYCDDCKASLSNIFKEVVSAHTQPEKKQEEGKKKKARMHIVHNE